MQCKHIYCHMNKTIIKIIIYRFRAYVDCRSKLIRLFDEFENGFSSYYVHNFPDWNPLEMEKSICIWHIHTHSHTLIHPISFSFVFSLMRMFAARIYSICCFFSFSDGLQHRFNWIRFPLNHVCEYSRSFVIRTEVN